MNEYEFHLMQLADSFFPAGMYGLSGGLESFVKSGWVRSKNDVLHFVKHQLKYQLVPFDSGVLSSVMNFAKNGDLAGAIGADNLCHSMRLVKEVRIASARSGRQLLNCVIRIRNDKFAKKFYAKIEARQSAGTYPACLAVAANALGIPEMSAIRMMLYSYCASIVGAAVRLGIITHIEAQSTLSHLANDVNISVRPIKSVNELWQLTPLADIMQMRHEQDDLRMFIT